MKLLIDTHLLLWAAAGQLPRRALPYFTNLENTLYFSSASIWEVMIKTSLNRRDFRIDPALLYQGLVDNGYKELNITSNHVLHMANLPHIHKDPFDRILIAQALAEGLTLLSSDRTLSRYPSVVLVG